MEVVGEDSHDLVEAQVDLLGWCGSALDGSVRGGGEPVTGEVEFVKMSPDEAVIRHDADLPARGVHCAEVGQAGKQTGRDGCQLGALHGYLLDTGQRLEGVHLYDRHGVVVDGELDQAGQSVQTVFGEVSEEVPGQVESFQAGQWGERGVGQRGDLALCQVQLLQLRQALERAGAEAADRVLGEGERLQVHVLLEHGAEESHDVGVVHAERLEVRVAAEGGRLEQTHPGEVRAAAGDDLEVCDGGRDVRVVGTKLADGLAGRAHVAVGWARAGAAGQSNQTDKRDHSQELTPGRDDLEAPVPTRTDCWAGDTRTRHLSQNGMNYVYEH